MFQKEYSGKHMEITASHKDECTGCNNIQNPNKYLISSNINYMGKLSKKKAHRCALYK